MTNNELLRELRARTSAGMKDCKDALQEANNDLQKAIDIIKVKGLAISDGRTARVASEGRVEITHATAAFDESGRKMPHRELKVMVEINAETDFVANSDGFIDFSDLVVATLLGAVLNNEPFQLSNVEEVRQELAAITKENIVVRRWWAEEAQSPNVQVFSYQHSNNKIGVLLTMAAPTEQAAHSPEFEALGEDLAMQIAAMNPLAVSSDRLSPEEMDRQKAIFEAQLKEENKPEKMWPKIMEGKMAKYFKEVCLLEQESVITPKTTVKQVIQQVADKLGVEIQVVNFVRCQVGEGIEKKTDNLAEEVAKMM